MHRKTTFIGLLLTISLPVQAQVLETDSLALVALYDSTDGANWTNTWDLNTTVDIWYGVTVSGGRVTELLLTENQLSGSIPSELESLANLTRLYLNSNQLTGPIPAELGTLANLTYLSLGSNQLSGTIPPELGNLANLLALDLLLNQLTGSIPAELGDLANLIDLILDNNQLTGSIPAELGTLANLTYLSLYSNQLSGLPDLSTLTALMVLYVQSNRLTFEDLETNMGVAATIFIYAPQDSLDTTIATGDTLWLTVSAGGTSTQYQWMLNGLAIEGATDSSYTLYPLGGIDSGAYSCEMTNSIVTGLTLYSRPVNVNASGVVAIYDAQLQPEAFALHQNYPNPFNPSTTIQFDLPVATDVQLAVYDLLGREVVRLVNRHLEAGYHHRVWDGRDRNGNEVPTGIYFVLVVTPEFRRSIKPLLLK